MSNRHTLGRPSPDHRDLAASVLALARDASAAHAAASNDTVVGAGAPHSPQLPLNWTDHFSMRICNSGELETALAHAKSKGEDNQAVEAFLTDLHEQPAERALSQPPLLEALAHLADHFPNFRAVVDFILRRTALALLSPCSPLLLPPILLDGPPGIGKTAFSSALAYALDVPLLTLQMAHASASFDLAGLDPKYRQGGPGLLVRTVALGKAVDPLVLLDEVDKTPSDRDYDPIGPLYSLLEPSTAARFIDEGIKLPLNLSHVRWILTTNDMRRLDAAIHSRCQIFEIAAPTLEQGRAIACRVYAAMVRDQAWGRHFNPELTDPVADLLARRTPRELTRELHSALGLAALEQRAALQVTDFAPAASVARGAGFL
ncbi:MAG: AAA family ATPase [Gammaproteobacteria bacterium]|nr:AAA family ATPase [Gammaproteobacteria bacterium]MBU1443917.1 AAA family ATPase [Gammaproteobacteria bacterium]MBU2285787.1 AAA family ATPase [Gammaproteobacteria bacterium]MBU2410801.1 AAA family ATPase [Gammaproteobacteria bacterium]